MKKIMIIATGGTIAMKYDETSGGLVPAVSGAELTAAVPQLTEAARLEVREFSNVPSGYMTPHKMFSMAAYIDSMADEADGFVVTHGTDTLEETAYLLSLALHTDKPVCITGAMRGTAEAGADGPGNLLAAVRTAAADCASGKGVMVVMNDEIHAAAEVTKTHSVNTATFQSPYWGALGQVYFDEVFINRQPLNLQRLHPAEIEADVHLLKVAAGMDDFLFRCLTKRGVKGIVVEAFGCGNVPLGVKQGIEYACDNGVIVVLATRVHSGRVARVYSYEGSLASIKKANLIPAGEISGLKARLKLMLALGISKEPEVIKRFFI